MTRAPLTYPRLPRYHLSSLLYGADLGFHAEWLRDEPYEATTTGSEFIFWSPGVNSRPTQGEHEIRGAEFPASRSSFPHSSGKEDFAFRALAERLVPPPLQSEWLMTYELRCRECGKSWGNQPRSIDRKS